MAVDIKLVSEWKKSYGEIYTVTIAKVEYVFRALTFNEYDDIATTVESMADAEDLIIYTAVLWPEDVDLNKLKPGSVTSLAEEIVEHSGFTNVESAHEILEQKREEAQSFRFNMKAFVLATQPNYTEEQLDNMTFSQLASKVAMSERIIAINQATMNLQETGIQLEIIDPEEEKKAYEQSQKEAFKNLNRKDPYESSMPGSARPDDPIAAKLRQALRG